MGRREPIERLREVCLALPEATEKEAWGEPTFRVGGKMFAMFDNNHHDAGRIAVWCKAPPMVQEILVGSDPERFFVPPYVGANGWVGVRLDVKVDWDELARIVEDGYRMAAPKRLAAAPAGASGPTRQKPRAVESRDAGSRRRGKPERGRRSTD
jgi:hypothetical protein